MRVLKLAKCMRVTLLSFAPDGRHLAAVTSDAEDHVGSVVWLDVASGKTVRTIPLDAERCALAPDHTKLAVSYSPYTRPTGAAPVQWAKVPPDGGIADWINLGNVPHPHVFALGFSPDNARVEIGCSDQQPNNDSWVSAVHIAPVGRGKAVTLPVESFVGELAFSVDGRWLALTGGPDMEPAVRLHRYPAAKPEAVYTPKATRTPRRPVGLGLQGVGGDVAAERGRRVGKVAPVDGRGGVRSARRRGRRDLRPGLALGIGRLRLRGPLAGAGR
jgi:hypothetical protein